MTMLVAQILGRRVGPNIGTNPSHTVTVVATSTTDEIGFLGIRSFISAFVPRKGLGTWADTKLLMPKTLSRSV